MPPTNLANNSPAAFEEAPRAVLGTAQEELGESAEQVSLAIDMPSTYLRAYLEHGIPRALPGWDRRRLAAYLGVPDHALA